MSQVRILSPLPMENSAQSKPVLLLHDSYLAMIRNAVGSKMFRTFYALVDGKKKDLVNNGELACGFFVSTLLHSLHLIKEPHLTVEGTEKDLKESGWEEITLNDLRPGAVIIWAKQGPESEPHRHIGFFVGPDEAISTDSIQGVVAAHHLTFQGTRAIEKAYWHRRLSNS